MLSHEDLVHSFIPLSSILCVTVLLFICIPHWLLWKVNLLIHKQPYHKCICVYIWRIIKGKYLTIEVLGHKVCTSSISIIIAKLISKWVAQIYSHSVNVWEYLFLHILSKTTSYNGWEVVSHFNMHTYDLLMWWRFLSMYVLSIWLLYSMLVLFVFFAHFS
jgi:hypothetical protein